MADEIDLDDDDDEILDRVWDKIGGRSGDAVGFAFPDLITDDELDAALDLLDDLALELMPAADLDNLSPDEARTLLGAIADRTAEVMRADGEALLAELAPADFAAFGPASAIGRFFKRAAKALRVAYLAAALAVLGPNGMDADAREAAGVQIARQGAYLKAFEADVRSGAQGPDGTLPARAAMYGHSSWGLGQNVGQSVAGSRGMVDERRIHEGSDRPCGVCVDQQALGWQPVGTLLPLGDSPCRCMCHCRYEYRDEDGTVFAILPES